MSKPSGTALDLIILSRSSPSSRFILARLEGNVQPQRGGKGKINVNTYFETKLAPVSGSGRGSPWTVFLSARNLDEPVWRIHFEEIVSDHELI